MLASKRSIRRVTAPRRAFSQSQPPSSLPQDQHVCAGEMYAQDVGNTSLDQLQKGRDRADVAGGRPGTRVHSYLQYEHFIYLLTPPKQQAMLLRETMGISADGSEKMYRNDDTEAFENREPAPLVWVDRDHRLNVMHVFTAVDPSGGGASAFSICSCLTMPNGSIQVSATITNAPLPWPPSPPCRRRRPS